ncbi:MAG: hypothetical protein IPP56_03525 [Bacteroidetes bacterium]|nr:hypothetical protein [Bacteroidota bacterium]MBK9671151.1 hypothetical protein [Bacteroidota bacterium]MBK9798819.1 hypothetical protein [Bacteroidota bacterium]MBP6412241.1 hypothetical protein [Bacteroidia bacterium]
MRNIIFCALILFFNSCKKDNTSVSGKVFHSCTNQPLSNVLVEVYSGEDSKSSTNRTTLIESTTTSTDGSYEINFRASYFDEVYWLLCAGKRFDFIDKKKNNKLDLSITYASQKSILELQLKNIAPFDNNDSIYLEANFPNSLYPNSIKQYSYKGTAVNKTVSLTIDGCSPKLAVLKWAVTKNDSTSFYNNTVNCGNGGTSYYAIYY